MSAHEAPIAVFAGTLDGEVKRFLERIRSLPDVVRIAVMPDVHLAGDACVGTVVATRHTLRPFLLGSDLGCGVTAMPLGVPAAILDDQKIAARVLSGITASIPLMARARARAEAPVLIEPLSHVRLMRARDRDGVREHGTVGRGNHFVELQEDEEGSLWSMVHSGSRALGPLIQAHHIGGARPKDAVLVADSPEGQAYLHDVQWAIRYAASSRERMARAVAEVIADVCDVAVEGEVIDCHHDAVRREEHGGEWLWVHRKGAVGAALGTPVLIPGSMGTASYHCVGRAEPTSLASAAHGAGRALRRGEAMRRIGLTTLEAEIDGVLVDGRRLAQLRDEAPSAYKDIEAVMRAQRALIKRVRRMRPRLVHK